MGLFGLSDNIDGFLKAEELHSVPLPGVENELGMKIILVSESSEVSLHSQDTVIIASRCFLLLLATPSHQG